MEQSAQKKIVMMSSTGRGGMLSVVEGYVRDGVFDRWNIDLIATHAEGSRLRKLWLALRALLCLASRAMRGEVALLHCHVSMYGSFWRKSVYATLARRCNIDVILHLHGSDFKEFYDGLPVAAKALVRHQLSKATAILVLSESWRTYILSLVADARVIVLPNYVDLPERRAARCEEPTINVLFLGIIGHRKGTYDLLKAMAIAASRYPSLRLIVAGNGEVEQASAYARELGIAPQVVFPGWVAGDQKQALLQDAHVLVLPSYNEGLPVSVLEAMAAEVPVIATPVGGIPDVIVDGENGRLVSPGDVNALSNALIELAASPDLRARLAAAARTTVAQRLSRRTVLPILESLYAERTGLASRAASAA